MVITAGDENPVKASAGVTYPTRREDHEAQEGRQIDRKLFGQEQVGHDRQKHKEKTDFRGHERGSLITPAPGTGQTGGDASERNKGDPLP